MSTKVVHIGTISNSTKLYLIVSKARPGEDAIVISNNTPSEVGLWSYESKVYVEPLRTTAWHRKLWDGPEDDDWKARFWDRTKLFSNKEMKEFGAIPLDTLLNEIKDTTNKQIDDVTDDWF